MSNITPTIGRVVWYFLNHEQRQPWAALIVFVNRNPLAPPAEWTINVGGFDHEGVPFRAHNVPFASAEGDPPAKGDFAMWMPYQKGQAAKTEELEKHIQATQEEAIASARVIDDTVKRFGAVPGVLLIAQERVRQLEEEGWNEAHDDVHSSGQMANAAATYAHCAADQAAGYTGPFVSVPSSWPWDTKWFKPKDQLRNLVRAGALIAAEIDRVQRAMAKR